MPHVPTRSPRPRTLIHPGRFDPVRIQSMHSPASRHFRLALRPGATLYDALVGPLSTAGVRSASTTILGGSFERLFYCVAPPDPKGLAVVAYSEPRDAGSAYLVFGNATLGTGMDGRPLVHCHGTLRTADGQVRGGHIPTEAAIVGPEPVSVLVTTLDGFDLHQALDHETNMALLKPLPEHPHG